jgi:hypothetical protein
MKEYGDNKNCPVVLDPVADSRADKHMGKQNHKLDISSDPIFL